MAQLVWRHSPLDTTTAHLVYVTWTEQPRDGSGTAALSACGQVDVGDGRWQRDPARLAALPACRACAAKFGATVAEPAP